MLVIIAKESDIALVLGILGFFVFPCAIAAIVIGKRGQTGYKLGVIAIVWTCALIVLSCGYMTLVLGLFSAAASHGPR